MTNLNSTISFSLSTKFLHFREEVWEEWLTSLSNLLEDTLVSDGLPGKHSVVLGTQINWVRHHELLSIL